MKTLFATLFTTLSLLFMASCQSNDTPEDDLKPGSNKIPISIAGNLLDMTKVTNNAYESGDRLGVFVVNQTSSGENGMLESQGNQVDNMDFTLSQEGWTPGKAIYWKDNTTKAEFYCYQPFVSGNLNVSAHPFSVQTSQDTESGNKKSDFTWGKTAALAPTQDDVAIQTKHILSGVEIYIEAGTGFTDKQIAGFSKSVTFVVKPSCVVNLASGIVNPVGNPAAITAKQEDGFYSVIIPPQTVGQEDVFLKIEMNGQMFEMRKTIAFVAGKKHRLTATLNASGSCSITIGLSDWETGDEIKIEGGAKRVAQSGGVLDIEVASNASYDVEIAADSKSWITQLSTKLPTTQTLRFDVKPNAGTDSREGKIIFRNSTSGNAIDTVVVQQSSSSATKVHVDVPGTLGYLVEADVAATLTTLIVSGNIVADDFYFIRDAMPELEVLDISQTKVSVIPDNAFHGYSGANNSYAFTKLKTIKLPETVISIGSNAYSYLQNFETFDVSTVLVIRPSAFSYCRSLTSIDFNPNLRVLGYSTFNGCTSLASIHIPAAIDGIRIYSFQDCKSLKSVTFAPQSKLSIIESGAFSGCSSLETIEIPVGVTSLGSLVFNNCTSLKTITFAPQSELSIIESSAFSGCSSLETVELPAGVTDINDGFKETALKTITIPAGVTSLENYAFQNCKLLKSVTFAPQSQLMTIGYGVFFGCSLLEAIEIPAGVTSLSSNVFKDCTSLNTVTCYAVTPPTIGSSIFDGTPTTKILKVPAESVSAYKADSYWSAAFNKGGNIRAI